MNSANYSQMTSIMSMMKLRKYFRTHNAKNSNNKMQITLLSEDIN